MTVVQALQQPARVSAVQRRARCGHALFHVVLDERRRELDARALCTVITRSAPALPGLARPARTRQPRQVVVHVLHDHVDAALVLVGRMRLPRERL